MNDNEVARKKLCELLSKCGLGICDEPRRFRALLSDFCPDLTRQVNLLTAAVEHRIVIELQNSSSSLPWQALSGRLIRRLIDELSLTEEAAHWTVQTWGVALGRVSVAAQIEQSEPRIDEPRPPTSRSDGSGLQQILQKLFSAVVIGGIFLGSKGCISGCIKDREKQQFKVDEAWKLRMKDEAIRKAAEKEAIRKGVEKMFKSIKEK